MVGPYQKLFCGKDGSDSALTYQPGKYRVKANSNPLCCIFSGEGRCIPISEHRYTMCCLTKAVFYLHSSQVSPLTGMNLSPYAL